MLEVPSTSFEIPFSHSNKAARSATCTRAALALPSSVLPRGTFKALNFRRWSLIILATTITVANVARYCHGSEVLSGNDVKFFSDLYNYIDISIHHYGVPMFLVGDFFAENFITRPARRLVPLTMMTGVPFKTVSLNISRSSLLSTTWIFYTCMKARREKIIGVTCDHVNDINAARRSALENILARSLATFSDMPRPTSFPLRA